MPDKWEYPWYAAWDLAFHMVPFARIDPDFAKNQLLLFTREWYSHPNGQLPAYEWNFGDGLVSTAINPVHAYIAPGLYIVTLVVTSGDGCIDSTAKTIRVFASPTAGFTINIAAQCLSGNNFVFTNSKFWR